MEPITTSVFLGYLAHGAGIRLGDEGTKRILNYIDKKGYRKTEDGIRKAFYDFLNDPNLDTACYKCGYKWKRRISRPNSCPNCAGRYIQIIK